MDAPRSVERLFGFLYAAPVPPGDPGPGPRHTREPWTDGRFTYATDNVTLLRVEGVYAAWTYGDEPVDPPPVGPFDFENIGGRPVEIDPARMAVLKARHRCQVCDPTATEPPGRCPRCDGDGVVLNGHLGACYLCSRCCGTGMRLRPVPTACCPSCVGTRWHPQARIALGAGIFDATRIDAVVVAFAHQGPVVFYPDRPVTPHPCDGIGFTFHRGLGIVMSMDPKYDTETIVLPEDAVRKG